MDVGVSGRGRRRRHVESSRVEFGAKKERWRKRVDEEGGRDPRNEGDEDASLGGELLGEREEKGKRREEKREKKGGRKGKGRWRCKSEGEKGKKAGLKRERKGRRTRNEIGALDLAFTPSSPRNPLLASKAYTPDTPRLRKER